MAEGEKAGNSDSWWGGWLAAAKEKTEKVFEMVSSDMAEFTSTMQADTKKVVDQAKDTLQTEGNGGTSAQDKLKKGFSSFMEGLTKVLTVEPEDTSPPKPKQHQDNGELFDRAKARLRAIQIDTGTYIHEPSGPPEKYAEWLKSFDIEQQKGEISEMLVTKVEVRSLYTTLVPSQVSHPDFWRRYFYKVHQLEMDEARKQALMKRAESSQKKEDSFSWDDDEWSGEEDGAEKPEAKSLPSLESANPEPSTVIKQISDSSEANSRLSGRNSTEKQSADNSGSRVDQSVIEEEKTETQSSTKDLAKSQCDSQTEGSSSEEKTTEPSSCDNVKEVKTDITPETKPEEQGASDMTAPAEDNSNSVSVNDYHCDEVVEATKGTTELKTKVKGDLVVVGSERTSPSSESSGNKESSNAGTDDDWERDFDVELTEDDLKAAEEMAKKLNVTAADYTKITGEEEDWESWD